MEGAVGAEFQDWEVLLHDLNLETALPATEFSGEKSTHFGGIEGESDSDSIIKSDYFSLDNQGRRGKAVPEHDVSELEGSIESDNPSWIDPSSENRYGRVNSGELWSDSGSDRSDDRKFKELNFKTESRIAEFLQVDEELSGKIQRLESLESHESKIIGSDPNIELALEEFDEIQSQSKDLSNFWSESSGDIDESGSKVVRLDEGKEQLEENKNLQLPETKVNAESGSEFGDKRKIWWKVPFEVLKYCLFKASPVWSFSVAAALMGFIILGRKLYKMKRKSQSLHLKVILDEKVNSLEYIQQRNEMLNFCYYMFRFVYCLLPDDIVVVLCGMILHFCHSTNLDAGFSNKIATHCEEILKVVACWVYCIAYLWFS